MRSDRGRVWRSEEVSGAALLRVDISAEYGVHAGEVPLASVAEPLDDVAIEPQMNGGLAGRQNDTRRLPEILAERFGFRGVIASWIAVAIADGVDFAKGISDRSRFPVLLD